MMSEIKQEPIDIDTEPSPCCSKSPEGSIPQTESEIIGLLFFSVVFFILNPKERFLKFDKIL